MNELFRARIDSGRENLRRFGLGIAAFFCLFSLVLFFRNKNIGPAYLVSLAFLLAGVLLPGLLKPVYIFWVLAGLALAWINTRIILIFIFYFVLTPIAIGMRLAGIDLLDINKGRGSASYWKEKGQGDFDRRDYERQF